MMRERLEEFESMPRRGICNQPYSLAVHSATLSCRVGAWVNRNSGYTYLSPFLGVSTPTMALSL